MKSGSTGRLDDINKVSPGNIDGEGSELKTSKPIKVKGLKVKAMKRDAKKLSKRGSFVRRRRLQLADKVLEEAAKICLSPSSEHGDNTNAGSDRLPEFESTLSSIREEL